MAAVFALAGCQQAPYKPEALAAPAQWATRSPAGEVDGPPGASRTEPVSQWWTLLHDAAIDTFVETALASSPDLAQALARMDAASAALEASAAAGRPAVGANLSLARGSSQVSSGSGATQLGTAHSAGSSFAWEVDLFGRIKAGREAATLRLDARTADAQGARVSLAAQVMDAVVSWRACESLRQVKEREVESWEKTLAVTRQRLRAGAVSRVEEARTLNDLATARINAVVQRDSCMRTANSLVALTGLGSPAVLQHLAAVPPGAGADGSSPLIASAPSVQIALPASVLAQHPAVLAAQREAQAAWSDIDAARASRYPRLDLAALLTGQWLRAAGQASSYTTWSAGPQWSAVVYDGGAGAAQVGQAEARYREATAKTVGAVRTSAREVEDALSAMASADDRAEPASQAAAAARTSLRITQHQWEAGATSLLQLEDARRQDLVAQSNAIAVARDRSQSWIALVRATGNQGVAFLTDTVAESSHAN